MNENIAARLLEWASREEAGARTAIVQVRGGRESRISFAELARRVERTAAGLRAAGIGPGARVLLFLPMSIDLYVSLLATLHAGAAAVFVDAWADRKRLDSAVRAAAPDLLIAPPKAQLLRLISPALRRVRRSWVVGGWRPLRGREGAAGMAPVARGAADIALITLTTGSTGAPKAAPRSHGLLWAQHRALADHLRLAPDDVDMPTLPIFVLNNLALGITSVIPDFDPRRPAEIDPPRILAQIAREGVTTTSGSPAFYARLAEWSAAQGRRLPVRLWTGGAPVFPPLAGELDRLTDGGAHVVYGSTEAEPIAGIGAGEMVRVMASAPEAAGICGGAPVAQVALRIIRPVAGAVELGPAGWSEWEAAEGEIVVAGDHVVGDYLNAAEETRRHKIRDGARVWHRTGDGGRLDEEGRLWLLGRISSRVVRAGETWWSTPAEVRALTLPGVRHAAFLGMPDAALGQRAVLCLEGAGEASAVRAALGPIPVDEIRVLRRIPRDPRHDSKTDLEALRRMLEAG